MFAGNFGFGIEEHIDLGIKYDPYTGIFGMDFYVVLCRSGKRVKYRKKRRSRMGTPPTAISLNLLGVNQKISKQEAIQWFEQEYQGEVM